MRMEKCGWKIANDTMQMTKSLSVRKINLRCFLKVLFVNKSSHLIELILGLEKSNILYSIKETEKPDEELREFETVIRTRDVVEDLYNFREFSQLLEYVYMRFL